NHTMTTAFGNSVVWYYQKLAAAVGTERMQQYLDKTHYGNANLSGGVTKFWLDSTLRISPLEQVLFLRQFYAYDLPFSHQNIDTVKRIMVMRRENGSTLSGKTGTAGDHLSWFVGYLETGDNVYFFATKVEGKGIPNARARAITESILKEKQVLR
ncbi:MAG: penicillin-binding transpeptidase domain-containing protein, partial [Mycobacterium leprae]